MFNVGVYVRVKFRAFGITFGSVEKAWTLGVSQNQPLSVTEIQTNEVPNTAKKILDRNGVIVKVW